jgi:tRNA-(ms[2]io[6]A)-hydroxylase
MEKHVLGLELATDPRWVNIAEKNIREILIDHAYCEQKAASSCISLIIQFPENSRLVDTLTPIVAEEWSHFERVLQKLRDRGWALGLPRKDEYIIGINAFLKKGGDRQQQLVEKLLLNALIEARSCERFRLLSKEIKDKDLSEFYFELMTSEAGHYKVFLALAKESSEPTSVTLRWKELLRMESELIRTLKPRGDRLH